MIACGGGTLGTMLARAGRRVSIVEVDPVSFTLAKRYFGLPPNVACHVDDGLALVLRQAGAKQTGKELRAMRFRRTQARLMPERRRNERVRFSRACGLRRISELRNSSFLDWVDA